MALANYSTNESWERIYNALIGVNPNDQEGYLGQMPLQEAWSRIAQQVIQVNVLKVGNLPK